MNYNKIYKKHINKHVNNKIQLLCCKNNLKAFYNYVNSSRTKPLACIKSKVNSEFLNDRGAANEFAKVFHSTYGKDIMVFCPTSKNFATMYLTILLLILLK